MFSFSPIVLLARMVVLLIAMPIHEWAHAWSAYEMGDDTASMQGRLSINPLAHLDLLGSLLILMTGFGWAKPVPVNPYRMRRSPRSGMALSALAGPAANLVLAMLCATPFRLGLLHLYDVSASLNLATLLWLIAQISIGLGVFNLIPLFPLDGEKVLIGVLPPRWGDRLLAFRPYSPYALMAVLFLLPTIGLNVVGWLVQLVMNPLIKLLFVL
jgi:Zn-dependent protease